jgi:STE24 endopeptidase
MLSLLSSSHLKIIGSILSHSLFLLYVNHRQWKKTFEKSIPKEYQQIVTQEEFTKARLYSQDKLHFANVSLIVNLALTIYCLGSSFYQVLWSLASELNPFKGSSIATSLVMLVLQTSITLTVSVPLSAYSTFWVEQKHGFNQTSISTFVGDVVKGFLLECIGFGLVFSGLIYIVLNTSERFYIYMWLFSCAVLLFFMLVFPSVIQPLFNKVVPLEEGELKEKINELAKALSFPLTRIYLIDGSKRSSHSNAYFYGFFKNKHIVIFDTLLKQCSTDEIVAILAHELGHWHFSHTLKLLMLSFGHLWLLFWGFGKFCQSEKVLADFGFVNASEKPIYVSIQLFMMLIVPLEGFVGFVFNAISRIFEYQADSFALHHGKGALLKDALVKLLVENKSNMNPDWLFSMLNYSHPTVAERIQRLRKSE